MTPVDVKNAHLQLGGPAAYSSLVLLRCVSVWRKKLEVTCGVRYVTMSNRAKVKAPVGQRLKPLHSQQVAPAAV